MSEYTEQAGFPVGRDWNTAQMALMRCRDEVMSSVNIYMFGDYDLTVAATSEEEAHAFLVNDRMLWLHPEDVMCPEKLLISNDDLFEDRNGRIRFPDIDDADGENRVYPFREALDIMLVELGWEAPFIFTEEY